MDFIKQCIEENMSLKQAILEDSTLIKRIKMAAQKIIESLKQNNKVLFCGNGGSAADAQHLAAELMGKLYIDRDPLLAISLTTNTSSITAIANDIGYTEVFFRQLKALGNTGDTLVSLSTSGNSESIIKAMNFAREKGIYNIAITGQTGGTMKDYADLLINIPSTATARIQECHVMVGHIICEIVEREIFLKQKIL
jgi:D-sedoheptulose 7-phosphate isomerase